MPYTMEDFRREFKAEALKILTPQERLEGLSPEEILASLTPEEILAMFTPEELEDYLKKLKAGPRKLIGGRIGGHASI
jgi:hypothetical protein